MSRYLAIFLSILMLVPSCDSLSLEGDILPEENKTETSGSQDRGDLGSLLSCKKTCELSTKRLAAICDSIPSHKLLYDVECYKITYRTLYISQKVDVSALVIVPKGVTSSDMLAYLHGTWVPGNSILFQSYSDYDGKGVVLRELSHCALPLASQGYFVIVPDYVGFGDSYELEHPYTYYPELFKEIIDALYAMRSCMESLGLECSNRLFLTGWSQGAGAGLAAHKYIQEGFADDFEIVASSLVSGPYDFVGFVNNILSHTDRYYLAMPFYTLAAYTLNRFSPLLGRPNDQIFRKSINDQYSALLNVMATPRQTFRANVFDDVMSGRDTTFCRAMKTNTFSEGWIPTGKVFLHHGDDDDIVPYFNSANAAKGLDVKGNVKLYTYEGDGHFSVLWKYINKTIDDFNELR